MPVFSSQSLTPAEIRDLARLSIASYPGSTAPSDWRPLVSGSENVFGHSIALINNVSPFGGPIGAMVDDTYVTVSDLFGWGPEAAQVFTSSDNLSLAVSFRGTDFDILSERIADFSTYPGLIDGTYIDKFVPLLDSVASYAEDFGIFPDDIFITGHSLGAGAANQLRDRSDISDGFFSLSKYLTLAAPVISANDSILNIAHDNDLVYAITEDLLLTEEGNFNNGVDNLLYYSGFILSPANKFNGQEDATYHSGDFYTSGIDRLTSSLIYDQTSRDDFIVVLDEGQGGANLNHAISEAGTIDELFAVGSSKRDVLFSSNTDDVVDGMEGDDIFVLSDDCLNYSIVRQEDGSIKVSHLQGTKRDGVDTLYNFEWIRFTGSDQRLSISGGGGQFDTCIPDAIENHDMELTFVGDDLTQQQSVSGYKMVFTSNSSSEPGIVSQSNPLDFFNQNFVVPVEGIYTTVDSYFDLGFGTTTESSYSIQIIDENTGYPLPLSSLEIGISPSWGDDVLFPDAQAFRLTDFFVDLSDENNTSDLFYESEHTRDDTFLSNQHLISENLSPLSSDITINYFNPIPMINTTANATLVTEGKLFDTYSFSYQQLGDNPDPERSTPEGTIFRGGALFYVKANPAPIVYLDFDNHIPFSFQPIAIRRDDAVISDFNPFLEKIEVPSSLSNFSDAEKKDILLSLRSIYSNSNIPIHVTLDEPSPEINYTRVLFSGEKINYSFGSFSDRIYGEAYEGIDQFDKSKNSTVGIWMDSSDNLGVVAEVIAHEVGHAFGAQHINPFFGNDVEVMDYHYAFDTGGSGVTPKFTESVSRVVNPPFDFASTDIQPSDGTHNPAYHILKYAVGVSDEYLEARGLSPGDFDVISKPSGGKEFFSLSLHIDEGVELSEFGIIRYAEEFTTYEKLDREIAGEMAIEFAADVGTEFAFAGSVSSSSELDVLIEFAPRMDGDTTGQLIGFPFPDATNGIVIGSARLESMGSISSDELGFLPPVARPDSAMAVAGNPTMISILDNDFDPDGGELQVVSASNGENGVVRVQGDDTVEYTPMAGFLGSDVFSYTVANSFGVTSLASVTVEVVSEDTAAQDDTAFTFVGRRVMIDPLSNDTDVTENTRIQSVEDLLNGQVYVSEDRSVLIYEPDPLFVGTDSFRYTISQGAEDARAALVSVDVGNWDHAGAVTLSTGQRTDRVTQYNLKELFSGLVGDVNGDSIDDRAVHEGNTSAVNFRGPFYEVQGTYTGTNGFQISGENGVVRRVEAAGDFNGDGTDDLAVWWSGFDPGPPFTTNESVFILYGKASSFDGTVNLDSLASDDGIEITGFRNTVEALDLDLYPIAGGGDFNNDGFDDLVIGSPGSSFSIDSFGSGLTFVLLGSDKARSDSTFNLYSSGDLVLIDGGVASATSGLGVDWVGDLNSDGFDDFSTIQLSSGVVGDIVFGQPSTGGDIVTLGDGSESLRIEGARGVFVNAAKDVNGDLLADYVLGVADGLDDVVYLVLGHEGIRPGILDLSSLALGDNAFKFVGHTDGVNPFGASGVGDLDRDGFNDLAIATRTVSGTNIDIILGGHENLKRLDASDGSEDGIIEVGERFDRLAPEPGDVEKNVLIGEDSSGVIVGSDGPDVIVSGAGAYDKMRGGGSADQFVFGSEAANGVRERSVILDYEVGIDEIVLIEGASAASVRETSSQIVIFLEGDRDAIYVRGDGVTADNIIIVTDDVFEFI